MNPTKIEWCDFSSNPIYATVDGKRGWFCVKVSNGCKNCYAEAMNLGRFGNGVEFLSRERGRVEFVLNEKELAEWRKPKYRGKRVFAFDMTDLFGEWVSDEWLDKCFAAMALAPDVTFQILTKRPERMRRYLTEKKPDEAEMLCGQFGAWARVDRLYYEHIRDHTDQYPNEEEPIVWPLPNVWLGVTVENQRWADERIPILLDTPAAVRFLSCEPLLGPVQLTNIDAEKAGSKSMFWINSLTGRHDDMGRPCADVPSLDWVIVGGESGPRHRPFDPHWARSIVAQCHEADVSVFVKQLGGMRPGNKLEDLPEDLRVREFPR